MKTPASVFFKDRVKGEVVIKDDMPPGRPFTVKVECAGQVVWEKRLSTEQTHLRTVAFDFPVQTLIEKVAGSKEKGVKVLNQALTFRASLSGVDGEKEKTNNDADFSLHAIVEGADPRRPSRWEIRYLRNLFDRDSQWEVNALVADRGSEGWTRGKNMGQFPADRETLFSYDMIVFGEVPRQLLNKMEEQEWIRDFVAKRGGGLLVIDGAAAISNFAGTPLEALFPVDWKAESGRPTGLRLTERGARRRAPDFRGGGEEHRLGGLQRALGRPRAGAPRLGGAGRGGRGRAEDPRARLPALRRGQGPLLRLRRVVAVAVRGRGHVPGATGTRWCGRSWSRRAVRDARRRSTSASWCTGPTRPSTTAPGWGTPRASRWSLNAGRSFTATARRSRR